MGFKTTCPHCGKEREVKSKANVGKQCRACYVQFLRDKSPNKIDAKDNTKKKSGHKHTNKEKFRSKNKENAININWDDMVRSPGGLKKYKQTCIRCGADRGYQQSQDWKRTCWKCKSELATKYTKEHRRLRKSTSVLISSRLRSRRSSKMGIPALRLVDFTLEELILSLESKFQPGMTWENYGEWEVDHIRPDSSFNYDSPNHPEFKECWSLNNLQPLWKHDNAVKSAKWEG